LIQSGQQVGIEVSQKYFTVFLDHGEGIWQQVLRIAQTQTEQVNSKTVSFTAVNSFWSAIAANSGNLLN
jgi:hypothetical protein